MNKKIYITESQLSNIVENKKRNKKDFQTEYIKADRRGRRESDRDIYGDGFKSNTRISKTQKAYSRKGKNQNWKNYSDDE